MILLCLETSYIINRHSILLLLAGGETFCSWQFLSPLCILELYKAAAAFLLVKGVARVSSLWSELTGKCRNSRQNWIPFPIVVNARIYLKMSKEIHIYALVSEYKNGQNSSIVANIFTHSNFREPLLLSNWRL